MIEGTLVRLRPQEMTDLERYHRWFNDREVTRYLGGHRYGVPMAAEEDWLRGRASRLMSFEGVSFAIETKDGGHIGSISLFDVSPEDRSAEIGIVVGDRSHWDRGFGSDAMVALMRLGFGEMNLHRIDLTVEAKNARARRAYERIGFVEEARLRQRRYRAGAYTDVVRMAVLRDEFEARHGAAPSAAGGGR